MSEGQKNGRNERNERARSSPFPASLAFALGLVVGVGCVMAVMFALGHWPPAPGEPLDPVVVQEPSTLPDPPAATGDMPPHEEHVDLLSEFYPSAVAGDEGWDYHRMLTADLNGDGRDETVHVIANAGRYGPGPDDYSWDDGHIWNVYIEDADGQKTDVFRGWVQLGQLRVRSLDPYSDDGTRGLALLLEEGAGITLYRVVYAAPGELTTTKLAGVLTWNEAQPVR